MAALFQRLPSGRRFLMALVMTAIGACTLPLAGQQTKLPDGTKTDVIKPGDWLRIQVVGTLPDAPIEGRYQVEASGKVALGPHYGRVQVDGKTLEQAETILSEHLSRLLAATKLQITRYEAPPRPTRSAVLAIERRVDKLEEEVQGLQTAVRNSPPAARDAADARPRSETGSAVAKAHPAEAKAILAAANGYWEVWTAIEETRSPDSRDRDAEEVHLWSSRLLRAERALAKTEKDEQAALLGHWRRMEQLYRKVKALFETGSTGGEAEKLAAAKYYRAEAELWLVDVGGTVPDDRFE